MNITDSVQMILHRKGTEVYTISPEATVYEAIRTMAEKNVGALVVLTGGKVAGIVSERDYSRKVILKGKSSKETPVRDVLSSHVISVTPDDSVQECMRLMVTHRIRHLPVLRDGGLLGVVSIGDLVNWTISAQSQEIDQLKTFITGQYPG